MSFIPQTEERSSPLIAACDDKYVQVTQLLINHGADLNYQDNVFNLSHFFHNSFLNAINFPHSMVIQPLPGQL